MDPNNPNIKRGLRNADGTGVLAASAPSRGKLTTDSDHVLRISFTVTEKIKEYADWLKESKEKAG